MWGMLQEDPRLMENRGFMTAQILCPFSWRTRGVTSAEGTNSWDPRFVALNSCSTAAQLQLNCSSTAAGSAHFRSLPPIYQIKLAFFCHFQPFQPCGKRADCMRDHNNSNLRILCYLSVTTPMLSCLLALDEPVSPARILPGGLCRC